MDGVPSVLRVCRFVLFFTHAATNCGPNARSNISKSNRLADNFVANSFPNSDTVRLTHDDIADSFADYITHNICAVCITHKCTNRDANNIVAD